MDNKKITLVKYQGTRKFVAGLFYSKEEKEKIYQMYLNGESINQIHLKLKHTRPYIKKVLIEKGIPSDYIIKQGSIRWKNRTKGGQDARN